MKKRTLMFARLVLTILLALTLDFAVRAGDDWRTVTPGDLAMKPTVDPDADAEAIFGKFGLMTVLPRNFLTVTMCALKFSPNADGKNSANSIFRLSKAIR